MEVIRDPLGAAISYVKRRRTSDATTQNYGVAGATNVIQRAYVKGRKGRKPNAKKYLLQLAKCGMTRCIQRFHGFKKYEEAGFFPCGHNLFSGILAAGDLQFSYPVYVFDITSCRRAWPDGTANAATPLYQLVSGTTGNFSWNQVNGRNANDTASLSGWFVEDGRGVDGINPLPTMGPKSYLEWSDIRLALYGATGQTTKWTVQFIQFTDQAYHPRSVRQAYTPVGGYGPNDLDQVHTFNAAMESLTKPLVYHPLHSAGKSTPVYKVMESKSMTVQPDSTTNEGVAPPNICYKLFKRMNRVCNWKWQLTDSNPTTGATTSVIDANTGEMNNASINQQMSGKNQPYVSPNARVYMMIFCTSYLNTATVSPIPSGYSEPSLINTPSFDLQVRNKWVYDAT